MNLEIKSIYTSDVQYEAVTKGWANFVFTEGDGIYLKMWKVEN